MQFKKEWMVPAGVGIVSFGLGALAGYLYSQRRGTKEVTRVVRLEDNVVEAEPEEVIYEWVEGLEMDKEIAHEEITQEEIAEGLRREREAIERALIREAHDTGVGNFNIFEGDDDEWDYDVEVPLRSMDHPYIIHRDEFYLNEEGYSQSTLTYYAGDDVLCDEQDAPWNDYKKMVGVLEFGKGSLDISIVYVRNDRLQAEWEIIIDHGYYLNEILGEDIEHDYEQRDLKHSLHKFKVDE